MPGFTFLHCADVHLGAPVRGLGKMPAALRQQLRDAPGAAFARIVDTAIDQRVAALLIAGDLFDAEDRNLRAQVQLAAEFERLDEAGISTFVAAGNHDPLGGGCVGVRWPSSVHVFGTEVSNRPVAVDGVEVARVWGVSYERPTVPENLAEQFPRHPGDGFHIGMLHTNVGDRPGHGSYSPCRLDDLTSRDFDYWALGHVHTRETLHARAPVVHYPGNPQALHTREPGARGATLVHVRNSGAIELEPLWTDVVRWHRIRTSIEGMTAIEDLSGAFGEIAGSLRTSAPNRLHLVRWTLFGNGPLHAELNRPGALGQLSDALRASQGLHADGDPVWLERIDPTTSALRDIGRLRQQQDYLGDMLRLAQQLQDRPPLPSRHQVGDASAPVDESPVAGAVREALADLFDAPRVHRALGSDPWEALRWKELLARSESIAVEYLAPEESDA